MLYSYKGQTPRALPHRIVLSDGRTRTNRASFTIQEIRDAGYTPAPPVPNHEPKTQHPPVWENGDWVIYDKTAEELAEELGAAKAVAVERVNDAYESELNAILKDYPDVETKTWDKQEQEARAWAADNTVDTPLIAQIAKARGLTLAELAPRVIAKADVWMQLSGAATGKRQALEAAIDAATTVEEVEVVVW